MTTLMSLGASVIFKRTRANFLNGDVGTLLHSANIHALRGFGGHSYIIVADLGNQGFCFFIKGKLFSIHACIRYHRKNAYGSAYAAGDAVVNIR